MKFVITGATSFIGLELIHLLLLQGHSVVAVCRGESQKLSAIPSGVTIVIADMSEYGDLQHFIERADIFINLAWGGTGHDDRNTVDIQKNNIIYTTAAIFAAVKMDCKLFVEAGSQAEYGSTLIPQREADECQPFSEYGKAKLKVKNVGFELSEQLGLKYIHLRIFSMFGENDHPWTLVMSAIRKMVHNEPIDLSSCTQNWNFVYAKDAVRMIMNLCVNAVNSSSFKHEVYNIASNDTRPLKDFVEEMKLLSKSESILHYGAIKPQNLVSLQPNMSKTLNASGFYEFHDFSEVITHIINNYKNGIYD